MKLSDQSVGFFVLGICVAYMAAYLFTLASRMGWL